jgi:acetyl esterase/lipase
LVTAGVVLGVAIGSLSLVDAIRGPAGASSTRTVTYCVEAGQALAMTLFAPSSVGLSRPAVLQVHGGGWQKGGRLLSLSQSDAAADLVGAGFVVASIDYRLAPANPWPDQIIDAKCAVRYLRAHAADLGIDPDRIAALGDSAGGQMVSLLGTTGSSTLWDTGPYPGESSAVDAVVDEFGPADLTAADWPARSVAMIRRAFGVAPGSQSAVLGQASPVNHVSAGDPPFLIVQGTDDQVVPENQSGQLASQLRTDHVPVELVLVDGGRHGLETPGENPSPPAIAALITSYLVRTLHG